MFSVLIWVQMEGQFDSLITWRVNYDNFVTWKVNFNGLLTWRINIDSLVSWSKKQSVVVRSEYRVMAQTTCDTTVNGRNWFNS